MAVDLAAQATGHQVADSQPEQLPPETPEITPDKEPPRPKKYSHGPDATLIARFKAVFRKHRMVPERLGSKRQMSIVRPPSLRRASSSEALILQRQLRKAAFNSDIDAMPPPLVSALAPHHKMFSGRNVRDTYSFRNAELLGSGGIGSCQTVRKRSTGQVFALKSVQIEDAQMLEEFRQECAIQRSLDHPNIVRVYESYEEGPDRVHIVMELCTGGNLVPMIEASIAGMDERVVADLAVKMLSAIYYMHQRGFVHRDIKPDNIMYESKAPDAEPKLIDFGFACHVEKGAEHIKGRYGTLSYMAPELLDTAKKGAYDSSVDLWSFGVTLYTLLVARKPFDHDDRESKKRLIREANPSYSARHWGRVSPAAIDFVKSLIQKDPSRRLSASQALQHPWLAGVALTSVPRSLSIRDDNIRLPPQLVQSLLTFSSASLLTRMALEVIAFSLLPQQLHEERWVFALMDADRSGTVSRDEFVQALSKQTGGLASSTIHHIFDVLDVNRSDQLDFNEFCAAAMRCRLHALASSSVVESAFRLLDKDNDGYLTLNDLQATFSRHGFSDRDLVDLMMWFGSTYDGLDLDAFWQCAMATGRAMPGQQRQLRQPGRLNRCVSSPGHRSSDRRSSARVHGHGSKKKRSTSKRPPEAQVPRVCRFLSEP